MRLFWKLFAFFTLGLCASLVLYVLYLNFFGSIIYRTPFGFFPATVHVPIGTTVTFKNFSRDITWPASDQHPDHTVYKAFDARGVLEPGKSWSFTFDRQGIWNYHDHVSAQLTGEVIVYGENGDTSFDCQGEKPTECWAAEVDEALRTDGVAAAFATLQRIHDTNLSFATNCHGFAHDVGLKSYLYYGKDATFGAETSYCNAGFYHGFMEGMIGDVSQASEAEAYCRSVGERLGDTFPLAQSQCIHGIGHGMIEHYMNTRPELLAQPKELMSEIFSVCASIETNEDYDEEMRCVSGAFDVYKGFVVINNSFDFSKPDTTVFSVCAELDENAHKRACYWQLSRLFTRAEHIVPFLDDIVTTGSSSRFIYDQLLLPEEQEEYLGLVTRSWAIFIGKRAVYDYPSVVIAKACEQVPFSVKADCLEGVFEGAFISSPAGRESERMNELCADKAFASSEIDHCYAVFQRYLFDIYSESEALKQCSEIPQEYSLPGYCTVGTS